MPPDPIIPPKSTDLVYTEADLAEMRERWETAVKEQRLAEQIAALSGQMSALQSSLPAQIEAVASRVVADVLAQQEQRHVASRERRWIRGDQIAAIFQALTAGLMAYLVLSRH